MNSKCGVQNKRRCESQRDDRDPAWKYYVEIAFYFLFYRMALSCVFGSAVVSFRFSVVSMLSYDYVCHVLAAAAVTPISTR